MHLKDIREVFVCLFVYVCKRMREKDGETHFVFMQIHLVST